MEMGHTRRMGQIATLGVLGVTILGLNGCGGNPSDRTGTAQDVGRLTLQLTTAEEAPPSTRQRATLPAQTQQDEGPLTRVEIQVQGETTGAIISAQCSIPPDVTPEPLRNQCQDDAGGALLSEVNVTPTTITIGVTLEVQRESHRITVAAFAGTTMVQFGTAQDDPQLAPVLVTLFPVITPSDLENRTFRFDDGTVFGFPGQAVRLDFGAFRGTRTGPFTLRLPATSGVATGTATVGSLDIAVTNSTFPELPAGSLLRFQAVRRLTDRLNLTRSDSGISSLSSTPTPSTTALRISGTLPRRTTDGLLNRIEVQVNGGIPPVTLTIICQIPTEITTAPVTDQCQDESGALESAEVEVSAEQVTLRVTIAVARGDNNRRQIALAAFVQDVARFFAMEEHELLDAVEPVRLVVRPLEVPTLTVLIGSPASPVPPAGTFTVPVLFNAASARVLSYLLELTFDPTVVTVDSIRGITPFANVITNVTPGGATRGVVRFAANNQSFTPASGQLALGTITFRVLGPSGATSPLTLNFATVPGGTSALVDHRFQPIAEVAFVQGTVRIQ